MFLSKSKYNSNKSTYFFWAKYFAEGVGQNSPFQLDAFLVYCLNYFVFPSPPEDGVLPVVFPIAVLLAQGKRLALTPWYLGALYARFDECSKNVTRLVDQYNALCYVNANFFQLFLWERFRAISPMPHEFKAVQPQVVEGVMRIKTS